MRIMIEWAANIDPTFIYNVNETDDVIKAIKDETIFGSIQTFHKCNSIINFAHARIVTIHEDY